MSHVPFKAGEVTLLPSPMFHALGYMHAALAMFLGSTLVLRRRFKPALVLEDIEKHKATSMVVVPVMLSRILDQLEKTEPKPDLSSLKIVFVSGSQLGAELATRALGTSARSSTTCTARPRSRSPPSPAPRICSSTPARWGPSSRGDG